MCGIIGIISDEKNNIYGSILNGLFHLQHRGQDVWV